MSYFENINKSIDKEVISLLKNISAKYSIDEKEILEMWTNKEISSSTLTSSTKNTPNENALLKLSRNELVEICKGKGLKFGGTKNDLVSRISDLEKNKTNLFKNKEEKTNIVNKLVEKIPVIEIKKNKFGRFEHFESSLLYDNISKKIYGKQNSDGSVSNLTKEDIDTCNKYKFTHVTPDNLNSREEEEFVTIDDENELEEDEEEDEEEEEDDVEDDDDDEEEEIELEDDFYE